METEAGSEMGEGVPGIQAGGGSVDNVCRLGLGQGAGLGLWLALSPVSPQSAGSDQERTKKKRRGDRYSVQTSLIVATLKKMLPIGLNMCAPTDQDLIMLAKTRYALVPAQPHSGTLPDPSQHPTKPPGP